MENLNAQQVFDRVSDHLLTQKKKSLRPRCDWFEAKKPECAYRGVNGLKCAVGALLTDYDMKIVKETVLAIDYSNKFETIKNNLWLVDELQKVHDNTRPSRWIEKLAVLAKKHNLDASVLKKYRKPLTKQQIFDQVATHLLTQKKKCMSDYEKKKCAYRNYSGLRCAVGCLITDNEYSYFLESVKSSPDGVDLAITLDRLLPYSDLLHNLQDIHDRVKPSKWINKLSLLADKNGLNKDVLKKFRKVSV